MHSLILDLFYLFHLYLSNFYFQYFLSLSYFSNSTLLNLNNLMLFHIDMLGIFYQQAIMYFFEVDI